MDVSLVHMDVLEYYFHCSSTTSVLTRRLLKFYGIAHGFLWVMGIVHDEIQSATR